MQVRLTRSYRAGHEHSARDAFPLCALHARSRPLGQYTQRLTPLADRADLFSDCSGRKRTQLTSASLLFRFHPPSTDRSSHRRVNLYGILTLPAPYFPFAMLGMDLLNGGPGAVLCSFTGMVAAHAYYFLAVVCSTYLT